MQGDNLDLLRALEADEAAARRRALWTSSALVVAAAAVLAVLLFSAYRELNTVRASTATLRADSTRLSARVAELQRVEANYVRRARADVVHDRADTLAMTDPADTLSPRPATGRDTAGGAATHLPPEPARLPARVYLQIVRDTDRAYAGAVGARLDAAGFQVLSTEYVRDAAPLQNTELRYYKKADEPDAQRLLQALRAAGEPNTVLLYLGLESNTRVRPRHYEVWFAAGAGQASRTPAGAPRQR